MQKITYRWAKSLGGGFDGTPEECWGIEEWEGKIGPVVFCGLYGLPDFYALWRHDGKKWIWWCGSDILQFVNGYWLEDGGNIKIDPTSLAQWIDKYCESWCENEVEAKMLAEIGIKANICPSFLGDINNYKVEYKPDERPQVYLSANVGREKEYGWGIIENIADRCEVDFHLFGSPNWETKCSNVFIRGRIPKEQMNEEIKKMQCGLRLNNEIDGFSEITAKSILWGQYPIVPQSYGYPNLISFRNINNLIFELNRLKYKIEPNPARDLYREIINKYPWNKKQ